MKLNYEMPMMPPFVFNYDFNTDQITDIQFYHNEKERPIDFGDYVYIEQKRYGVPNEFYLYKVITRLRSNSWVNVPVQAVLNHNVIHHEGMADVISCVCGGVHEFEILKFRVIDVKRR